VLALNHEVRPIYSRDQGIQMRGLKIHRLCLNRHLPKVDQIADHSHGHCQILMYLGGSGSQKIAAHTHAIKRGSLFFVPPGAAHSFIDSGGYKPLCLAIDFDLKNQDQLAAAVRVLTLVDLEKVRRELSLLTRWRIGKEEIEPREAAAVLRLIDIFLRALGFLPGDSPPAGNNVLRAAQRALHDAASYHEPLASIAKRIGYHPDYLNRMLKRVCGLTLGELRGAVRLQTAKRLLAKTLAVSDIAAEVGFDDPNYFARWFRAQTGYTPTDWRAGAQKPAKSLKTVR
jgi:AraC-like DNA-binding protein